LGSSKQHGVRKFQTSRGEVLLGSFEEVQAEGIRRDELQPAYDEIGAAFERRDLPAVMKFMSPEWQGFAKGEDVELSDLKAHLEGQFRELENIRWHRTLTNPRLNGDQITVLATGTFHATKTETGEKITIDLANDDTWTRSGDDWLIIRSIEHGGK
jgi:hypothetical protein